MIRICDLKSIPTTLTCFRGVTSRNNLQGNRNKSINQMVMKCQSVLRESSPAGWNKLPRVFNSCRKKQEISQTERLSDKSLGKWLILVSLKENIIDHAFQTFPNVQVRFMRTSSHEHFAPKDLTENASSRCLMYKISCQHISSTWDKTFTLVFWPWCLTSDPACKD